MTLDEAILHCDDVSRECTNSQCSLDHIQLREWLIELKQYRELNKQRNSTEQSILSALKPDDLIFNPVSALEAKE